MPSPLRWALRTATAALIVAVFVVVTQGTAAPPPDHDARQRVDELRLAGDLQGALATARGWREAVETDPTTRPWQLVDARRAVIHLDWLILHPDSVQTALSAADILTPQLLGLYAQGEFDSAADLAERQLAVRRAYLPPDHEDIAESLRRLGVLNLQRGRYGEAGGLIREALTILSNTLGNDHPRVAKALATLATVERLRGDFGAAEPLYRQALAMRRRILEPESMDIVSSLHNLAIFLSVKGDYAEAESLFEEVLEHQRRQLGVDHPDVGLTLHNLGNTRLEAGRPADAVPVMREALAHLRHTYGDQGQYVAGALHSLGTAQRELGRVAAADTLLRDAEHLYRDALGNDHPHVAEVIADRGLARWLAGDLQEAESLLSTACEVHERARLNVGLGYERSDFQVTPYGALAAAQLLQGRDKRAWTATERALGRTLADLLSTADKVDSSRAAQPLPIGDIQRALDPHTAIIGWLDIELRSTAAAWVYVVRHEGPVHWARIPEGAVVRARRDAAEFRDALDHAGSWPFRVHDTGRIDEAARRIHEAWIAPLAAELAGVDRLVVLPSGSMLGVPVEALRDRNGELLDSRFAISYSPSASLYARYAATSPPSRSGPGRALLVGDPQVDDNRLASLPGARDEVRELAAIFPDATILLGAEASETALSSLNAKGELTHTRWIHLATHALADAQNPDRSALVLAAGGGQDGLLTAAEIVRDWRITADLVTLSGCSTALGRPSKGEGYIGLAHAFLRAGARNLLVSLWTVEDEATRRLMGRFYDTLLHEDVTPAEALRRSRLWLREWTDEDGGQPFRHPAYWSGFVLIGAAGDRQ